MSSPKRKFLIFLLTIFTLIIFAYARKEIFFQQAKKIIKQNLEKSFPVQLSIERIRAGFFYGLVLEDVEVNFPPISNFTLNLKVEEAWIGYNLWEAVFLGHQEDIRQLRLISPDINLSYLQGEDAGVVPGLSRSPEPLRQHEFTLMLENGKISFGRNQPLLKNLQGKVLLTQEGIYFQDFRASLKDNSPSTLRIYGELLEDELAFTANAEHLKINNFDILSNFALALNKRRDFQDKAQKVRGTLKTYGSVLNNRPIPELNSSFEIQDDKLRILTFSLGDSYDLRGIVGLRPPFNADLSLNFYQAAPSELVSRFSFPQEPNFSGLLNGSIKITGSISQPKVDGYLEAKQGHIGDLEFLSADINIKGEYPRISVVDSRILREEDSFLMQGEIDLANLERQDSLDLSFEADKGMLWQGWDITRKRENQVHMSKSIADDLKVTFDAFMEDERVADQDNDSNELGLEYRIFGDKLLKLRLRRDEGILGLERRMRF